MDYILRYVHGGSSLNIKPLNAKKLLNQEAGTCR
jgi:hypothetical protein